MCACNQNPHQSALSNTLHITSSPYSHPPHRTHMTATSQADHASRIYREPPVVLWIQAEALWIHCQAGATRRKRRRFVLCPHGQISSQDGCRHRARDKKSENRKLQAPTQLPHPQPHSHPSHCTHITSASGLQFGGKRRPLIMWMNEAARGRNSGPWCRPGLAERFRRKHLEL